MISVFLIKTQHGNC